MSGKWDDPRVPKRGWSCFDIDDLGDVEGVCDMCEVKDIRYVHWMSHPDWPHALGCGCICAGHMEEDQERARRREATFRQGQRWLARRWRCSMSGNEYINAMGYHVAVWRRGGVWAAIVKHRASGWQRVSQLPYWTSDEAKLAALDVLVHRRSVTRAPAPQAGT